MNRIGAEVCIGIVNWDKHSTWVKLLRELPESWKLRNSHWHKNQFIKEQPDD